VGTTLRAGWKTASWRSPIRTRLPTNASPASPKNAPASPPVLCFRKPMMLGPKKPPLEPIALMSAIPAAADVPLRNFVGRHQKGDIKKEELRGRNPKEKT